MLVWIKPLPGDKSALGEDEHVATVNPSIATPIRAALVASSGMPRITRTDAKKG